MICYTTLPHVFYVINFLLFCVLESLATFIRSEESDVTFQSCPTPLVVMGQITCITWYLRMSMQFHSVWLGSILGDDILGTNFDRK